MSLWSGLLSLHGYLTHPHNDDAEVERPGAARRAEADRLIELIGSRTPSNYCCPPEPSRPLLGVRGLA